MIEGTRNWLNVSVKMFVLHAVSFQMLTFLFCFILLKFENIAVRYLSGIFNS